MTAEVENRKNKSVHGNGKHQAIIKLQHRLHLQT